MALVPLIVIFNGIVHLHTTPFVQSKIKVYVRHSLIDVNMKAITVQINRLIPVSNFQIIPSLI